MRSLLRLTLLCVFAAAGVGLAISLVVHTDPQWASPDSPLAGLLAALPHGAPLPASSTSGREPAASGQRTANQHAAGDAAAQESVVPLHEITPAPAAMSGPVAQQMERLEQTLSRVEEANKQSQIERLERTLERVQQAADRNEQLFSAAQTRFAAQPPAFEPGAGQLPASGAAATDADASAAEPLPLPAQPKIEPGAGDGQLVINVKNSDIREVLDYLGEQTEINILASPNVRGNVTASLTNVSVEEAVSALLQLTGFIFRREGNFLYVGTPQDLQAMDQLRDKVATRIYRPNYVSAGDLQVLIAPVLTQNVGQVTVSTAAEIDIPSDNVHTGGDSFSQGDVLLVRDYEQVLLQVDAIVADVDRPPRQVMIEAMILSVSLDDTTKMGVNLEALRDKNNVRVIDGSPLLNLGNIDVSEGGLNVGFLDSTLAVFIEALDTVGDTEVIAAPRLLCLNKQRAEILIGDQKGYLNTTQTETATTQTVEFLDVGTQLRIRPFISSDGMIRMEVHPELSTGDVRLLGTFALPEKSVTQVTTNIMCRDGATVVIGGLIRDDVTRTINQIPLLGNLRLLGPIFRHKNDSVQRNEIIVVITPHVIQDPLGLDDGRPHVSEMHRRQSKVFVDRMTPVARRYYSNRYVRLAESAWLAGNGDQALSYIDLALHFTPRRFEALNLRDEILTGGPGQIELIQSLEPLDYVDDPPLDAPAPPPSFSLPQPPVPADGAPASLPQATATPSHRQPEDVVTPVPIQRTSLLQDIGPPPLGAPLP